MVCGFLFDELQISQDWADKGATYIHVSSDSWKQSLAKTTSFSKQPKKKPTIPKGPHVPLYHCFYLPLRMSFTGLSHSSEICFHSQRKTDTTSDLFSRKAQLLILMNSPKQRFPIFPSATTHSSSVVGHNASGQNDLPGIFRCLFWVVLHWWPTLLANTGLRMAQISIQKWLQVKVEVTSEN